MCSAATLVILDSGNNSREGHNFLRLRKGRRVMQIYARDHVEAHPQKKKEVLYLVKTWEK